jgi:hypothetical protein
MSRQPTQQRFGDGRFGPGALAADQSAMIRRQNGKAAAA